MLQVLHIIFKLSVHCSANKIFKKKLLVPKVESGEWVDVPKVKVGEQTVKGEVQ